MNSSFFVIVVYTDWKKILICSDGDRVNFYWLSMLINRFWWPGLVKTLKYLLFPYTVGYFLISRSYYILKILLHAKFLNTATPRGKFFVFGIPVTSKSPETSVSRPQ